MDIMVSVLTTAYNHAPYIAECIESILCQKTNFKYELIIHDDASTDGTTKIIQMYAEKYPDIIRPIFQSQNKYSQGIDIYDIMRPLIRGKYVAYCEGDDKWCDTSKIQMQVDFLEKNPQYIACVHNTRMINEQTHKEKIIYSILGEKDIGFEDLIVGGSSCYHTSSLMHRSDTNCVFPYFMKMNLLIGGDYRFSLLLALQGKIHYFPSVMSVYRFLTPGSWVWTNSQSHERILKRYQDLIYFLNELNKYTDFTYTNIIQKVILMKKFKIAEEKGEFDSLKKDELRYVYTQLPISERIKITLKQYFKPLYMVYREKKRMQIGRM